MISLLVRHHRTQVLVKDLDEMVPELQLLSLNKFRDEFSFLYQVFRIRKVWSFHPRRLFAMRTSRYERYSIL